MNKILINKFSDLIRSDVPFKSLNGVLQYFDQSEIYSKDTLRQQSHYDKVYADYIDALTLPQTEEYMAYMNQKFLRYFSPSQLGDVAEICCGTGAVFKLIGHKVTRGVGIDISQKMLEVGIEQHKNPNIIFIQADALNCPLQDSKFDYVVMEGGIHHINNREALFTEIYRILKPGGIFIFREPASDWIIWKWIRKIIYYLSPGLDYETERPLCFEETVPLLKKAGFQKISYENYTFIGFCLFMNADILKFNKLFKYIPGIKFIVRIFAKIDDFLMRIKYINKAGLQVIGTAMKV